MKASLRMALQLSLLVAVSWLGLAFAPAAQDAPPGLCPDLLADAEARYLEQDYAGVETLVNACVYSTAAGTAEVTRAYRLLALSFMRQGLFAEAQVTVVKLLGANYSYEPDAVQDPPSYVALVGAVKDQLRVTAPPPPEAPTSEASLTVGGRINVNLASAEALESLNGIGPVLASRIIEYRESYGPFRTVEELLEVRGIGPRTLERLAPYVAVEGPVQTQGAAGGLPADTPATPPTTEAPRPVAEPPAQALRVDLNTASAPELEQVSGIGPVLASRIVEHRTTFGPFRSTAEVMDVPGIGPGTYERIAPYLTVGGESD